MSSPWHELPDTMPALGQTCWVRTWWFTTPFQAVWFYEGSESGWILPDPYGGVLWFVAPFWRAVDT